MSYAKDRAALKKRLQKAEAAFEAAGGRGVELAEEIDELRFDLRSMAASKAAATRQSNKAKATSGHRM